ncbi:MAG: FAD-linked oxidase C-terminal domain-containing protein [Spirochaetota bacterium]
MREADSQTLRPEAQPDLLIEFDGPDTDTVDRLLQAAAGLAVATGRAADTMGTHESTMEAVWKLRTRYRAEAGVKPVRGAL